MALGLVLDAAMGGVGGAAQAAGAVAKEHTEAKTKAAELAAKYQKDLDLLREKAAMDKTVRDEIRTYQGVLHERGRTEKAIDLEDARSYAEKIHARNRAEAEKKGLVAHSQALELARERAAAGRKPQTMVKDDGTVVEIREGEAAPVMESVPGPDVTTEYDLEPDMPVEETAPGPPRKQPLVIPRKGRETAGGAKANQLTLPDGRTITETTLSKWYENDFPKPTAADLELVYDTDDPEAARRRLVEGYQNRPSASEYRRAVLNHGRERALQQFRGGGGGGRETAGLPQVKSIADYRKVAPGQQYIDPNGNRRTKGADGG